MLSIGLGGVRIGQSQTVPLTIDMTVWIIRIFVQPSKLDILRTLSMHGLLKVSRYTCLQDLEFALDLIVIIVLSETLFQLFDLCHLLK
jgi:hypothetical protein